MRRRLFIISFLALVMVFTSTQSVVVTAATEGPNDCDDPTQFVTIKADKVKIAFDLKEIKVDKDTCVQLTFVNLSPATPHDFSVDADADSGFPEVYVYIENNVGGINGTDTKTINFKTPNVDVTLEYYCSITGHRDGGMYGDLIIGNGTEAPGFEISFAILALGALVAIPMLRKR